MIGIKNLKLVPYSHINYYNFIIMHSFYRIIIFSISIYLCNKIINFSCLISVLVLKILRGNKHEKKKKKEKNGL